MAAHAIASITISFGLVSIPVRLYASTQASADIHFNLLHEGCGSRLRQQYVCIEEDVVVPRDRMIKGYEFSKDRYVTFTRDELKALEEAGTGAAEIVEFVPLSAVDPVYYEKSYYLSPDKGGAKPYALLHAALARSGRSALGRYAARGKQYIVLIRALDDGLAMQQLYYPDEVRTMRELDVPSLEVGERELALAIQLVEQLSVEAFEPGKYQDTVRQRIEAAIAHKVAGEDVTVVEAAPAQGGQIIDLMAALRASLRGKTPATGTPAEAPRRKPARRAAAPADEERSAAAATPAAAPRTASQPRARAAASAAPRTRARK